MSTLKDVREIIKVLSKGDWNPLGIKCINEHISSINTSIVDSLPDETEIPQEAEKHLSSLMGLIHLTE